MSQHKNTSKTAAATDYRTQAEAERDARAAIWGEVSFAKRPFVMGDKIAGTPFSRNIVAATVNGRTVVFSFDQYGRRVEKPLVLR